MKCITLYEPWASWIMMGWKTIETRTHARFACLKGERIGIHAGEKWDDLAIESASEYLEEWQAKMTLEVFYEQQRALKAGFKGRILGSALVIDHRATYRYVVGILGKEQEKATQKIENKAEIRKTDQRRRKLHCENPGHKEPFEMGDMCPICAKEYEESSSNINPKPLVASLAAGMKAPEPPKKAATVKA